MDMCYGVSAHEVKSDKYNNRHTDSSDPDRSSGVFVCVKSY